MTRGKRDAIRYLVSEKQKRIRHLDRRLALFEKKVWRKQAVQAEEH